MRFYCTTVSAISWCSVLLTVLLAILDPSMSSASAASVPAMARSAEHDPWQSVPCNDEKTSQTRAFVSALFSAVSLDNFGASFAAALSDDLTWTVTGSSPIAGTYHPKSVYLSQVLAPLRKVLVSLPIPVVEGIYADGDVAVVNWRSENGVKGKNGANYDMDYTWIMKLQWEKNQTSGETIQKIVTVKGFYDGQKVAAVFQGYNLTELRSGQ